MSAARLVGRTLRLAAPLYLATLVLGALPTTVAVAGLGLLAADRPWRDGLLDAGWLNLAAEIMLAAAGGDGAGGVALTWLALGLLFPAVALVQLVAYSFLAGGIIAALGRPPSSSRRTAAEPPAPAAPRDDRPSFWAACRRWFWPNLALTLFGGAVLLAGAGLGAILASLLGGTVGPTPAFVLQAALQALVWGWLEAARATLVVEGRRGIGPALRRGLAVARRPVAVVAWLLLALPSVGALAAAAFPPQLPDPTTAAGLVVALLYGQAVVYLGAWTKVVRLAVARRLVEATAADRPPPVAATSGTP